MVLVGRFTRSTEPPSSSHEHEHALDRVADAGLDALRRISSSTTPDAQAVEVGGVGDRDPGSGRSSAGGVHAGRAPTRCDSRSAASRTVRANGPIWSSDEAKATRP